MDMTNAQRQAAYRKRRAAQGIVQVQVFGDNILCKHGEAVL
jgi:hypothetical protein